MGKLSDEEKMGVKAGMVVAGILSTFALRYVEPTRGVGKLAMVSHALFAVFAVWKMSFNVTWSRRWRRRGAAPS